MPRLSPAALTSWITDAARQHPHDLPQAVAERTGVSLACARRALGVLERAGWLARGGRRGAPVWRPGALRQVVRPLPLDGTVDEHTAWSQHIAPAFDLPSPVARLARQACTELVNNAIDHSGGRMVVVSARQSATSWQLLVSDDGRGLFDTVRAAHAIDDPALAMLELAKGGLTRQPERHAGRGLFHLARLADVVDLHANAVGYRRLGGPEGRWQAHRGLGRSGTSVYVSFALDSTRCLADELRACSADGEGCGLDRTRVPLRLLTGGADDILESRALARRVAARLDRFSDAELDFAGVAAMGHAFADELFRVLPRERPALKLTPVSLTPELASLVEQVLASA